MDTIRQVRFLIAPFFFYCSLLLGAILSGKIAMGEIYCMLKDYPVGLVAAVGAALTASLFPLGFLIGAITYILLDGWYWIKNKRKPVEGRLQSWELTLSPEAMNRIWSKVGETKNRKEEDPLYAAFTLNHEILKTGISDFTMRIWSAFSISAHSITALILALIIGYWINIKLECEWLAFTFICVIILVFNARRTWRHTMRMLDYQSRRIPIETDEKAKDIRA